MRGAIPPLYAFMVWCLIKIAQGQLYVYLYISLLSDASLSLSSLNITGVFVILQLRAAYQTD